MQETEVIAFSGAGDKRKEVGRKKIQVADTYADCTKIAGSEAEAIKLFNQQNKTNTRNSLARPAGAGVKVKVAYGIYLNMIKAGVPKEKALGIAELSAETLKTCEEAA